MCDGATLRAARTLHDKLGNKVFDQEDFALVPSLVLPSVMSGQVQKSAAGAVAFVRPNGTYYAYANVSAGSNPISTVKADLSNLTSGAIAVALTKVGGPWNVGGISYAYRSAQQTAGSGLSAGVVTFDVLVTDNAANTGSFTGNVTVDNVVPTRVSVVAANGGTLGKLDTNDTLTFTFADANRMDPNSIIAGWSGAVPQNLSVTFADSGGGDTITIPGIGAVNLGSTSWLTGGGTQTKTAQIQMLGPNQFRITITNQPSNQGTGVAASNFAWSAGTATDVAGNSVGPAVTTITQRF